jgi:diaminohydroxyphosphoribosylaminopyrimidine deaminase/5-amino-6-(5-phosphoribosylamino)uracil reductase
MRRGRPWVRVKLAASIDGRTAMASGESKWITSPRAREDVQRLRARSSAILTGVGTVLADDPALTVRLPGVQRQPLRVIVDSNLSTPESARLLKEPGPVLIVTSSDDAGYGATLQQAGAEVVELPGAGGIDLVGLMDTLGTREINEVMVESGSRLCGALMECGVVDELVLYMAPHLLGTDARGMFDLPGVRTLEQRVQLDISDVRAVGRDWRITARVRHARTAAA